MTSLVDPTRAAGETASTDEVDVLVIGAGVSGLAVAALVDRAGIGSLLILESGADVGGTWRDNTYPGCACDIPSPLYSFSFAQKPDWTRLFAPQPEILDYLRDFASRRRLVERTRFGVTVDQARWLPEVTRWEVSTAGGQQLRARFVISAVGALHHPAIPRLPGIETFLGAAFHSAAWDHELDFAGKRVAVIGTGASAIQFVPEIADQVAALTVFQRTAPWIVPKADREFDARHRRLARFFPPYQAWVRNRLYWIHEKRAAGFLGDPSAMSSTATLARKLLARQVPDELLRARLTPDYEIGCKRLLISSTWYPTLSRSHVEVRPGPVREVTPDAVIGADGVPVPADVLIYGTGFDAQDTVTRMRIIGREGIDLACAWQDGNEAYLGTTVTGFPNFFIVAGPNTGLGHNSQIFMIEAQSRYIVDCLRRLHRTGAAALEVRAQVQQEFVGWLQGRLAATVWQSGGCHSWYQHARTGRNTILWPDTTIAFWRRTRRVRMGDYHVTN